MPKNIVSISSNQVDPQDPEDLPRGIPSTNFTSSSSSPSGHFSKDRLVMITVVLASILLVLLFCLLHSPSHPPLYQIISSMLTNLPFGLSPYSSTSKASNLQVEQQQLKVRLSLTRRLATEAWSAYLLDAKGDEALRPDSGEPLERPPLASGAREFRAGLTALEAASTFLVMGLRAECAEVRAYLAHSFHVRRVDVLCTPVAVTRYIGSLLSLHFLVNGAEDDGKADQIFLEKALEVAQLIRPAFEQPSKISLIMETISLTFFTPNRFNPSRPLHQPETGGRWGPGFRRPRTTDVGRVRLNAPRIACFELSD